MSERDKQSCKGEAGKVAPVINRNRCEAKEDCVRVCPYNVFDVQPLGPIEKASMSYLGRLKAYFHEDRQAFVVQPQSCHACQLCVAACPENAITLAPYSPRA